MNKNNIGLYLTDNNIFICTKEKIYIEEITKEIIEDNRINKSEDFYKVINKIIKKNKLNDSIIGKNVIIVDLPNYLQSDRELIKSVLEKTSFNNVKFIEYNELVKVNLFNLNSSNAIITLKNNIYINYNIFNNKDLTKQLINFLGTYVNKKDIFLIGTLANLDDIAQELEEKYHIKVYIYDNKTTYIIEKLQHLLN